MTGTHLNLLAFDLGASNGRAVLGCFDGHSIKMKELHRFDNAPVMQNGILHWNIEHILQEMKRGLGIAVKETGNKVDGFGIDTWGVDYGLLDAEGRLLSRPRCYRSARQSDMEKAFNVMSFEELFSRTGVAAESFNTLFQLYRRILEDDDEIKRADKLLLLPDLLSYLLTGEMGTEYTIATTTMLCNADTHCWDTDIIDKFGLPVGLFTQMDSSGVVRGRLSKDVAEELGCDRIPYVAVGCHDTASAVAAIPGDGSFVFCSSGTWSLFGVEVPEPMRGVDVRDSGFTNEGTVQNGSRTLKNMMGMWLIQECKRLWRGKGFHLSWDQISDMARMEEPFRFLIDPDHEVFFNSQDVERDIRDYCRSTGQGEPVSPGQIARCIFESLALKYRWTFENLSRIMGHRFDSLNIVGGGCRNNLLNQMVADSLKVPVIAGPVECASIGNLLVQAQALGGISDIKELRGVVRNSFETTAFEPRDSWKWDEPYQRLLEYMAHNPSNIQYNR